MAKEAKKAMTEEEKQAREMQRDLEQRMKDLSMTWNEGQNARKPRRALDRNDRAEFNGGLNLLEEARRRPGQGRSFDSCNGGHLYKEDNPEPDLFDIVEVFASKMR